MRKVVFMCTILGTLILGGLQSATAQDEIAGKKDSISIDDADPVYYDAEEDSDTNPGNTGTILAIAGGVVVAGLGAFFFLKKKKK